MSKLKRKRIPSSINTVRFCARWWSWWTRRTQSPKYVKPPSPTLLRRQHLATTTSVCECVCRQELETSTSVWWYPPSQSAIKPLRTCGSPVLSRDAVGHVRSRKRGTVRILLTSSSLSTMALSLVTSAKIVVTWLMYSQKPHTALMTQ